MRPDLFCTPSRLVALAVGLLASALLATPASASLVTNGDFEAGMTGWAHLAGIDNFITAGGSPGQALVLNDNPGPVPAVSQVIAGLVLGNRYLLSLDAKTYFNVSLRLASMN